MENLKLDNVKALAVRSVEFIVSSGTDDFQKLRSLWILQEKFPEGFFSGVDCNFEGFVTDIELTLPMAEGIPPNAFVKVLTTKALDIGIKRELETIEFDLANEGIEALEKTINIMLSDEEITDGEINKESRLYSFISIAMKLRELADRLEKGVGG